MCGKNWVCLQESNGTSTWARGFCFGSALSIYMSESIFGLVSLLRSTLGATREYSFTSWSVVEGQIWNNYGKKNDKPKSESCWITLQVLPNKWKPNHEDCGSPLLHFQEAGSNPEIKHWTIYYCLADSIWHIIYSEWLIGAGQNTAEPISISRHDLFTQ